MQKVGSTTDTADANGEYTNGNVANGVSPTIINAEMLNTFQRELVSVVEGSGLELDPTDNSQVLTAIKNMFSPGRLLAIKVITATQIYTPSLGTNKIVVEMVGGGGAGGSVVANPASTNQVPGGSGAGGEGGAYGMALVDPIFNSALITIGNAGIASTLSPTDGGSTSISVNGSVLLSVSGGATGTTMTGPYDFPATLGGRRSIANAYTGNFLFKINGKPGGLGTIFSGASAAGGDGGASYLSNGSQQGLMNNDVGKSQYDPTGYGCGGTGACSTTRTQEAGNASPGVVIIKEYA